MEYGEGMPRLFRREFGLGICSEGEILVSLVKQLLEDPPE